MIIKIPTFDNKVRSIRIDGNTIEQMADHLIGKKLSKYRENIYDADGDGKVTLKDFIHRIRDVAGTIQPIQRPRLSDPVPFNAYSLAFDGTNDYIDCGNDASLRITGNMTVSAWVKSSSSARQRFFTKYGSGTDDSFYLSIRPTTGKVRFNVASKEIDSSSAVNDGAWHHLVAQYTASTKLEVFIDGSSDGTNTSSIPSALVDSDQNLRIGLESDDEYPLAGNADEVAIFNAIVSVGDLRNGLSGQGNAVPADLTGMSNLQGWWRMGDGTEGASGTTIYDMSNNGTMTNMAGTFSTDVPA
jgi:hypothetical protein